MIVLNETKLRAQVERLAASVEFARANRMVQFLRYVVEKTLAGDSVSLRERQIGVAVFDRSLDWDPKLDNIVRSEARRLRSKLESYAAGNDPDETIRITIPTGGYGAHFEEVFNSEPLLDAAEIAESVTADPAPAKEVQPVVAPLPRSLWAASGGWLLLPIVACLPFVLFALFHHRSEAHAQDEYDIEPFSSEAGLQFSPAIAPDGKTIAFVWNGGSNEFDIYTKTIGSAEVKRITHDAFPSTHPAWSPDGQQLAFVRKTGTEAQLMVLNMENHRENLIRRLQDSPNMWGQNNMLETCQSLSWSPSGDDMIMTDPSGEGHGLLSISIQGGGGKTISKPAGANQDCYARISPDGSRIAFARFVSHAAAYLETVDRNGDHLKTLTGEIRDLRGVDWTPDGSHLIFASKERGAYQLRLISAEGGKTTSLPAATASAADPSVSPNGTFLAFVESRENWNVWKVGIEKDRIGVPERFLSSSGQNHTPSFSPDGKSIAFVSDRSGSPEIWLCGSDGQHLSQATHFGGPWLGTIRWSPDSRSIVFDSRPTGHSAVYVMAVDQLKPKLIEDQPFEVRRPSWSRDGRFIYFDITRDDAPEIWRRDLRTNQDQIIAPAGFMFGIESPDGSRLFYQESEQRHLWVSDPDGGRPKPITKVSITPDLDWTPVGTSIYFASSVATGGTDILAFDLNDNETRNLGHLNQTLAAGTPSFSVSPDGKTLLYSTIDSSASDIKLRRGRLP